MLEHCGRKFTVHELKPTSGGGYFLADCLDDKVKECPFCGSSFEPVPPEPPAEQAGSPRPKRTPQSKAGQA